MDISKKIGKTISRLRKEKGYSQEDFANKIGVHRTYIGMIERGEKNITLVTLTKIAKGFNMKSWEILREANI